MAVGEKEFQYSFHTQKHTLMEKKPWYKSKIVIICAVAVATIVGNYLTGFITTSATPEQIQAVAAIDPAVAETVKAVKSGENWFSAAGTLIFTFIGFIRVWFSPKQIA